MKKDDCKDARNTVVVALVLWAGAVAAGTGAGVFARLPTEVIAALALFAAAFSATTVAVDARVRAWLDRRDLAAAGISLLLLDGVLVAAGEAFSAGKAAGAFLPSPWAPLLLFGAPLTVALGVAMLRRLGGAPGRAALRRPGSKAPAQRRVAT
ncbi:MAG TPA: hypothetical protein PK042_01965 [Usitatibacteraceae bacterium]|nr:hypothetical protein [Usitatibacteraceae bacterium]